MVEANPGSHSPEQLVEIEEQIFETIDEEIRESHNFCKDLVLQWTQKIENLAMKHLNFARERLSYIKTNMRDFARMAKQAAYQEIKERLENILQTEEHRDRILIGQLADFLNVDGHVSYSKILNGLEASEKAVVNRCTKLKLRLEDANLTNEIQTKVAHTFTEIDQIIAQYGEGT